MDFCPFRSSLSLLRSRPHVKHPRSSTNRQYSRKSRTLFDPQLDPQLEHHPLNWNPNSLTIGTPPTIGTNTLTMGIRHTHRQPFLSIRRGGCNEAPSLLGCSQNVPVLERSLQTVVATTCKNTKRAKKKLPRPGIEPGSVAY